jgi:hypothetical protein
MSLVFYKGRAARGMKTDWMMHEFRLPSPTDPSLPKQLIDQNITINVRITNSYFSVHELNSNIMTISERFFFCGTNRTPGLSVGSSRRPVPWQSGGCRTPGDIHSLGQPRQRCSLRFRQCKLQSLRWRVHHAHCKLHHLLHQASSPAGMACKVSRATQQ